MIKEFILPSTLEEGKYYIHTDVTYGKKEAHSEDSFMVEYKPSPEKEKIVPIAGSLFSNILEKIKDYLLIILLIIIIILIIIFIIKKKRKKLTKANNNLLHIKGKKVYCENGNYVGKIKESVIEGNKVYGWLIQPSKGLGKKNILVNHKYVKSIGHVMIVDKEISGNLKKFSENK